MTQQLDASRQVSWHPLGAPLVQGPPDAMTRCIFSQRVVTPDGVRPAAIVIDEDHIVDVADRPPGDVEVHDVGALAVLPGLVDTHVHINEPGRTEWEGFATATEAAASGGVTTLVDMPLNCIPVTTTVPALRTKIESTRDGLAVDVGFWAGVVPGNTEELPRLAEAGVLGAKAFLCHSGIDDFPASPEPTLREAMRAMAAAGIPLLAHAELELPIEGEVPEDPRRYDAWLLRRPARFEDAAIALLIDLCRETGCAVHVVHLSSASALPSIVAAKAEGLPLTVETCPHYLCLRAEDIPDGATGFKCAPPIRDDANREALWGAVEQGVVDFLVTDHSPCTPHLKLPERGDFIDAWGGISSLSLGFASVWTEARRRGASLEDMATWMSARPAHFAGLGAIKGAIAAGHHADLAIVDPDATFEVRREALRFRNKISPYLGRTLHGVVRETWLRGTRVFDGREVLPACGRPLLFRGDR